MEFVNGEPKCWILRKLLITKFAQANKSNFCQISSLPLLTRDMVFVPRSLSNCQETHSCKAEDRSDVSVRSGTLLPSNSAKDRRLYDSTFKCYCNTSPDDENETNTPQHLTLWCKFTCQNTMMFSVSFGVEADLVGFQRNQVHRVSKRNHLWFGP